jgi:hypothetical protein
VTVIKAKISVRLNAETEEKGNLSSWPGIIEARVTIVKSLIKVIGLNVCLCTIGAILT